MRLSVFLLLMLPFQVFALPSITWDANPAGENVTHYNVYCSGQQADRSLFTQSPNIVGTSALLTDLPCNSANLVYYLVTATNALSESDDSTTVCWDGPNQEPCGGWPFPGATAPQNIGFTQ